MNRHRMNRQGGSALIYIFVGIALFAALTFAVSRSNRNNTDVGKGEKDSVQVSDYLTFANSLATTVKILKTQGCTDTQLNFAPDGAVNATSPADKSCDVYNAAGGGLAVEKSPPNWFDANAGSSFAGHWYFGGYCIQGVGTGVAGTCLPENAELLLMTSSVTKDMCEGINKNFNFNPPTYAAPDFSLFIASFVGTYGNASPPEISTAAFIGKKVGCFKQTGPFTNGAYWIFYTLLAR